jgi:hypothetical protein
MLTQVSNKNSWRILSFERFLLQRERSEKLQLKWWPLVNTEINLPVPNREACDRHLPEKLAVGHGVARCHCRNEWSREDETNYAQKVAKSLPTVFPFAAVLFVRRSSRSRLSIEHLMGPSMSVSVCSVFRNNGTGGPLVGIHYWATMGRRITLMQEQPMATVGRQWPGLRTHNCKNGLRRNSDLGSH